MGFWSPAALVNDAKRHGIQVLPVDIHQSTARCSVENGHIRLGLIYVLRMGEINARHIEEERQSGPYTSLLDFCRRTRLPRRIIEHLILIGAMDSWAVSRRSLLWQLEAMDYQPDRLDLIFQDDAPELQALSSHEQMQAEYAVLGLSTSIHPVAEYRGKLVAQGVLDR